MEYQFSKSPANRAAAYALRQAVFVEERGIDATVEFDDKDNDDRLYVVAYAAPNFPVATLRLEPQAEQVMRFGRVCTRKVYRGHGIGQKLLTAAEVWSQKHGYTQGLIHGEVTAQGFYERCDYQVIAGPYDEDGAPVVVMTKKF
ncbi:GNAT family N-acetyltransferase [Lactiplantibacillus sp. WILCCON 0030]|uniref:GNAT family N-acetyltransferase n=1 Tax=Lactiplantibacillus brownii TaxID=3069269 RepID=A0ABU1A8V4_9LACO|nr:GNAT family N-acetyltransferase [Lactiplantibacillus brownii]MDQ7937364.1 GNAT family N-acetyltransferase [Lactiplantibacillus brownii]